MAGNPKLKIKINKGKLVITILNFKVEMNVIIRKAANRFNLVIKQ